MLQGQLMLSQQIPFANLAQSTASLYPASYAFVQGADRPMIPPKEIIQITLTPCLNLKSHAQKGQGTGTKDRGRAEAMGDRPPAFRKPVQIMAKIWLHAGHGGPSEHYCASVLACQSGCLQIWLT